MAVKGWPTSAALAYNAGIKAGLSPIQALDFAGVQQGESGFNPQARNASSGAAGLYQLLSPGYVKKAESLGGVFDPAANIGAILPDYVSYYKSHPFVPGAAGAAVERSGEGADFYARGTRFLQGLGGTPRVAGVSSLPELPSAVPGLPSPDLGASLLEGLRRGDLLGGLVQGLMDNQASPTTPEIPQFPQAVTAPVGDVSKWAILGKGADRPGVATQAPVLNFVAGLGEAAGEPLTIGTGSNHSKMTVNGNVSNHWNGMAADIPAAGEELHRLGYLALREAGMSDRDAAKNAKSGGLFNVGPYQIIFATTEGGNHYNHLHVGLRG